MSLFKRQLPYNNELHLYVDIQGQELSLSYSHKTSTSFIINELTIKRQP